MSDAERSNLLLLNQLFFFQAKLQHFLFPSAFTLSTWDLYSSVEANLSFIMSPNFQICFIQIEFISTFLLYILNFRRQIIRILHHSLDHFC